MHAFIIHQCMHSSSINAYMSVCCMCPVHALSTSSQGRYLFSGSIDQSLKVWNLDNMLIAQSLQRHDGSINAVHWCVYDLHCLWNEWTSTACISPTMLTITMIFKPLLTFFVLNVEGTTKFFCRAQQTEPSKSTCLSRARSNPPPPHSPHTYPNMCKNILHGWWACTSFYLSLIFGSLELIFFFNMM